MMVVFLAGIVALILLRTLRKDYAKYSRDGDLDDLDADLDESGWKQVHGDVFRPPAHLSLFCALVGTGAQLAAMVLVMILFATATNLYMGRGAIIVSFLACYAATAVVGGYASGSLYAASEGTRWIRTMLWTASLFPAVMAAVTMLLSSVSTVYGAPHPPLIPRRLTPPTLPTTASAANPQTACHPTAHTLSSLPPSRPTACYRSGIACK
jgi:transmembrane 9 superfamily protein 3